MAGPARSRGIEVDLDASAWRDRAPTVQALVVERGDKAAQAFRVDANLTAHPPGNRHADLIEVDGQATAVPVQLTRADDESGGVTVEAGAAALGHGPALASLAVQRHVDRTVVLGIGGSAASRPGVVGRKDASNEGDDAQRVLPVVADRVDIPPEICTRRDRLVESRCAISVSAASRPDIAAIGTPGPGCTLPPAR